MSRAAMKPLLAVIVLAFTLALAAGASGAIVTSTDLQGRTITFDVRAPAGDKNWYAGVLTALAHGNEISTVTIRIVPDQQIDALCAGSAAAWSPRDASRPSVFIPA